MQSICGRQMQMAFRACQVVMVNVFVHIKVLLGADSLVVSAPDIWRKCAHGNPSLIPASRSFANPRVPLPLRPMLS